MRLSFPSYVPLALKQQSMVILMLTTPLLGQDLERLHYLPISGVLGNALLELNLPHHCISTFKAPQW